MNNQIKEIGIAIVDAPPIRHADLVELKNLAKQVGLNPFEPEPIPFKAREYDELVPRIFFKNGRQTRRERRKQQRKRR